MTISGWPFSSGALFDVRDFQHELQRSLNESLSEAFGVPQAMTRRTTQPPVSLWANDEGVAIAIDVPGVRQQDLDVSIVGKTVAVKGARNSDELPEGTKRVMGEASFGQFERVITLPYAVNPDRVDARLKDGVLQLSIARAEADKPMKIAINKG